MQQVYNVMVATLLSFLVIMGWNMWFVPPEADLPQQVQSNNIRKRYQKPESVLHSNRIAIKSKKLSGSISLRGLLFDDLILSDYLSNSGKHNVFLLKPKATKGAYFIDFDWSSKGGLTTPTKENIWQADKTELTSKSPVTFSWDNKEGVVFKIKVSIDDSYMFSVERTVINNSLNDIDILSHANINRYFDSLEKGMLIMHEGPVGVIKSKLLEIKYKDVIKKNKKFVIEECGDSRKWLGFSDKYWLVSHILNSTAEEKLHITHHLDANSDHVFKISSSSPDFIVKSGKQITEKEHFFAGPKELKVLENYEKSMNVGLLARAVDFGVLHFITRPIFILLQLFYQVVGNFGVAIILLTLFIRIVMLPLSIKSCSSMIRIKELQPEITKIKKLYGDDKKTLNKESVALFKKHNVTPMSGCLPTLLQVPVFFALYKVLFITIEMRQAPFFWWITDLSVPDPTSILNLFGLLDWDPPLFLSIGVLPIILGITVAVQQKLTSAKYEDSVQAFMAKSMPYVFVVLFASFPSGLVLYWIFNNVISIAQQVIVKRYLFYKNSKIIKVFKA